MPLSFIDIDWQNNDLIKDIAAFYTEASADIPHQEAEGFHQNFDAEFMRAWRERMRRNERIMDGHLLIDGSKIVGLSLFSYKVSEAKNFMIEFTGIARKYRGQKLAKYIKAKTLQSILSNYNTAGCIITGMAKTNHRINTINRQLGFQAVSGFSILKHVI